jgi:hypothetical protein
MRYIDINYGVTLELTRFGMSSVTKSGEAN